jgi:DNA-binding transcriptional ArsR family regulator
MEYIAHEVNIAAVAVLIGDPSRAAMLNALNGRQTLPASELARRAGISPQTASVHLAKLVEGGLLTLVAQGRHRYYTLANAEVAQALEALAVIAPPARVRSLRESIVAEQVHVARTCYDHLAGKLGVGLTQALHERGIIQRAEQERNYRITAEGALFLQDFGIELEALQRQRRALALACLDWSERYYHLAGALGAALRERLLQLGWIEQRFSSRAVQLTESGRIGLHRTFGASFRLDQKADHERAEEAGISSSRKHPPAPGYEATGN